MTERTTPSNARVDPAGRPLEGRRRQALVSLSILVSWICLMLLIFWATRGDGPVRQAEFFWGIAVFAWLAAEAFGRQRGLVWPTSALAIAGSLSLGFGMGLAMSSIRGPDVIQAVMTISATASAAMVAFLFRFRLPGLVSPIITFAIIALFLSIYGVDRAGLQQVEGLSPRGILAALINNPLWMALFGVLALAAVVLARRLDLTGDDFGVASARPLHLIGGGVLALVTGRMLGWMPVPLSLFALIIVWIAAGAWALRINRVAVMIAMHLAIVKPLIIAFDATFRAGHVLPFRPDFNDWVVILIGIIVADLVIWYQLHKVSLAQGWILGPGGRIPRPREGWMWRYWPYA